MTISQEHFCFLHKSDTVRQMWIEFSLFCAESISCFFAISLKWKYLMMSWCVGAVTFLHCYSSGTLWAHCVFLFVPVPYFRADPHTSLLVICKNVAFKCNWQSKSCPVLTNFQSLTRELWELAAQRKNTRSWECNRAINSKIFRLKRKGNLDSDQNKIPLHLMREKFPVFSTNSSIVINRKWLFSLSECGIRGNASDSHRKLDKTFWSE